MRYKNFIYNEKANAVFAYVPKVACTNWKSLLRYMAGHENWLDNKLAHDKQNGGLNYLDIEGSDQAILNRPGLKKFAMVRDPYSRVLSAYLNKVEERLPPKPEGEGDHFDAVVRDIDVFRKNVLGEAAYPSINLEVFLRWLDHGASYFTKDEHWAPQHILLRQPEMKFDFIGKLENLEKDSARILDAMDCDQRFPSQKDVNFAPKGAQSKVDKYFDAVTRRLVERIYAKDFECFGYAKHQARPEPMTSKAMSSGGPVRAVVPGLQTTPAQPPIGTKSRQPLAPAYEGEDASGFIQEKLDKAGARGGGTVLLEAGRYCISKTLELPTNVILEGVGEATEIYLNDGSNTTMIESESFGSFRGSNCWFADKENVPTGFGLKNLVLNGNRKANVRGGGVRFFGKRYIVSNVHISEVAETGFYSECGNKVGQHSRFDMPESIVGPLWVSFVGGHGVQYRGPHDGVINNVLVSRASKRGISIEFKAGEFDGSVDADMWHAYGCGQEGIFIGAKINSGSRLTGENCAREGIVISGTKACNLASISAFDNCKAKASHKKPNERPEAGAFNIRIDENFHAINGVRIYDRVDSFGGIHLRGSNVQLSGVLIDGNSSSSGSGIFLEGSLNKISGVVQKFKGVGGVGLETGGDVKLNKVELSLSDNTTAWRNKAKVVGNTFDLSIRAGSEQSLLDGIKASGQNVLNIQAISGRRFLQTQGVYRSDNQGKFVDMTTTEEQIIDLSHDLIILPGARSMAHFSLETSAKKYSIAYINLVSWDLDKIRVAVKLSKSARSGRGVLLAQLKL